MTGPTPRRLAVMAFAAALALTTVACSDDDEAADTSPPSTGEPSPTAGTAGTAADTADTADLSGQTVTIVAYDSFPEQGTPVNEALSGFTDETGIDVEIVLAGDAGTMVSKAALTAGNPEGDVMFGVDNTFLSRAVDEGVFEPYAAEGLDDVDPALTELVPDGEATPVDFGDVCINHDIAWFESNDLEPPQTLDDLTDERYADLLVVENPATSSPGMAFLLATIDRYGLEGWQEWWASLRDNGVEVVDGWEQAYYERFTWAGGGPKPLVVSYGSSPPAEVIFADPPRDDAPTGVMTDSCFRQVEFAGVLAGTEHPEAARRLVDFLVSPAFQETLALNLFVSPANTTVELPTEFREHAVVPDDPASVDPDSIAEHRSEWIDEWTEVVLR